jgi:glutaredoxin
MNTSVILYEHGCPRCKVLKAKLDKSGIKYENINDIEVMKAKGFSEAPKLEVDGVVMDFKDAVKWIGEQ